MIGEPEWPFGSTHCRIELYAEEKRISKRDFSIADDGGCATADNFYVT